MNTAVSDKNPAPYKSHHVSEETEKYKTTITWHSVAKYELNEQDHGCTSFAKNKIVRTLLFPE